MERATAYKASDGTLESSLERAAAWEMNHELKINGADISFSNCLTIIKYRKLIEGIFKQMDDFDGLG